MAKSSSVYDLIHSLSKDEVNSIVRYAKGNGDPRKLKYLRLFQFLLDQDQYNEEALREAFQGEKFLAQLSVAKNYLIQLILRVLVYHSRNPHSEMELLLLKHQQLIQRGQWKLARRSVMKALGTAQAEERDDVTVRLVGQLRQVYLGAERYAEWCEAAPEWQAIRDDARARQANLQAYEDLYDAYFAEIKRVQTPRGQMDMDLIDRLSREPLLSEQGKAHGVRARILFWQLNYFVALYRGEYQRCLELKTHLVDVFEAHAYLQKDALEDYLKHLRNRSTVHFILGNQSGGLSSLDSLRRIKVKHPHAKAKVFESFGIVLLSSATQEDHLKGVEEHMDYVSEGLIQYGPSLRLDNYYHLCLMLAIIHHRMKNFAKAIHWISKIVDRPSKSIRRDLQGSARVLLLMFLYDQGDWDALGYRARSVKRYFQSRGILFRFEARMTAFFQSSHIGGPDHKSQFVNLLEDIRSILSEPLEQKVLIFFNFEEWIRERSQ